MADDLERVRQLVEMIHPESGLPGADFSLLELRRAVTRILPLAQENAQNEHELSRLREAVAKAEGERAQALQHISEIVSAFRKAQEWLLTLGESDGSSGTSASGEPNLPASAPSSSVASSPPGATSSRSHEEVGTLSGGPG
jgi:hypothetical protein